MDHPKLHPEFKQQWLDALRSGKYQQGRRRLRNPDDTYCCLGVMCDLLVQNGQGQWVGGASDGDMFSFKFFNNGCHSFALLSDVVLAAVTQSGNWYSMDTAFCLTGMNDNEKKSFEEIADWIEENL